MSVRSGVSLTPLLGVVKTLLQVVQREFSTPLLAAGHRLATHQPPAWLAESSGLLNAQARDQTPGLADEAASHRFI